MNEQDRREYWAADRAAFEAAMADGGEPPDFEKWGLPGIEHAYKRDLARLMYFAWTEGREHERAHLQARPLPVGEVTREIRSLIANDGYAMTFQTLGQYRTALLKFIDASPSSAALPVGEVDSAGVLVGAKDVDHG